jgi:hypothetical protein
MMIYALTKNDVPFSDRKNIAQAIEDMDQGVIKKYVDEDTITHVMDKRDTLNLYCIFCGYEVLPKGIGAPRSCCTAQSNCSFRNWYFQHRHNSEDPGELGIKHPDRYGCYIAHGCEIDNHSVRHRHDCPAIVDRKTYCHLASKHNCISHSSSLSGKEPDAFTPD